MAVTDAHVCSWISHTNTNTTFFPKPSLFSHASAEVQGEKEFMYTYMKALSLTIQKLWPMLKLFPDKQPQIQGKNYMMIKHHKIDQSTIQKASTEDNYH